MFQLYTASIQTMIDFCVLTLLMYSFDFLLESLGFFFSYIDNHVVCDYSFIFFSNLKDCYFFSCLTA